MRARLARVNWWAVSMIILVVLFFFVPVSDWKRDWDDWKSSTPAIIKQKRAALQVALSNDLTLKGKNLQSQTIDPLAQKIAGGQGLTLQDKNKAARGTRGLDDEHQQNLRALQGQETPLSAVCPTNPEVCPVCPGTAAIDFGPSDMEKLGDPKVACWQTIVVPATRPYYEWRTKPLGKVVVWLDGQQPFVDGLVGGYRKAGPTRSIRFLGKEPGTKIWVKVGKSRREIEVTPSRLALK